MLEHDAQEADDDVRRRDFLQGAIGLASLPIVHGRRLGPSDARRLLERTARMRRIDNYLGGGQTYGTYTAELRHTSALVASSSCSAAARPLLMQALGEQEQLAGWASFDAGAHEQVEKHFVASLAVAEEAEDPPLAGNALAFIAYQSMSTGSPDLQTASAAVSRAGKHATPRVRALLWE